MPRPKSQPAPEVDGLVAGRPFVATWKGRPGRSLEYFRPSDCRPMGLRINVQVWDEGEGSDARVIEGDGRTPGFRVLDRIELPTTPTDDQVRNAVRVLAEGHLGLSPRDGDMAARTLAGVLTSAGFSRDDFFGAEAWLKPAEREGYTLFVRGEPDPLFFEDGGRQRAVPRPLQLESVDLPCEAGILHEDGLGMSTVVAGNMDDALRILEDDLLPYPSVSGSHEVHAVEALMPRRAP